MNIKTYSRLYRKDNELISEDVSERSYLIETLESKSIAIVTSIGPNGRFEFKLDSEYYVTILTQKVCRKSKAELYYDYSKITFDIPIETLWSRLYNRSDVIKHSAWIPIDHTFIKSL